MSATKKAPFMLPALLTVIGWTTALAADSPTGPDVVAIRAARQRSNDALAGHVADAAVAPLLADARILGSNGSLIEGAAAMQAAFARSFADADFVAYVRTPQTIEVGVNDIASEAGRWRAVWRHAGAEKVISGTYLATWKKVDGSWRIAAEQFIPLACTGGIPGNACVGR